MLTHVSIQNFKRMGAVDFELGQFVVLIGPNNSGKTTALQALALWEMGMRRWGEKRGGKTSPEKRPGVTINRRDLIAIPVPDANLLWHDLHVRDVRRVAGAPETRNVRIDITVQGVTSGVSWQCGLEFDYANEESFYCRPLRLDDGEPPKRMAVPQEAYATKVAYLPPMSGLADREFIKQPGEIGVLLGQGQTAQVLRNLCYRIYSEAPDSSWASLTGDIHSLFGVRLLPPTYLKERSEITMAYQDTTGVTLDLSSSGRGLQQTLLLLAHLYSNPGTILLLDEPDAHLEILRQRQIYQLLTEASERQQSQIVAASHSEVVLNEAAERGVVIAFVGTPHRLGGRASQVAKSLTTLGFDQYLRAEQTGWVLYVEGPTDTAILQAFALTLGHPAAEVLERSFVHYVATNLPQRAREHFFGLREAKPDLVGVALFDRLEQGLLDCAPLQQMTWRRREIENYLCQEQVLLEYATSQQELFGPLGRERRLEAMREAIREVSGALSILGRPSPWSADIKASDEFLDPLFDSYFAKLELPNVMRKSDYHVLAHLVQRDAIDPEVVEKLDAIAAAARRAAP